MIGMTFQLIAFFMVLINFTEADQNEKITLPVSVLAKPPEVPFEHPIFLQLTDQGNVIVGGEEIPRTALKPYLTREAEFLKLKKRSPSDATIIIRADAKAPMGVVQEIIEICQQAKFENFALRAEEDVPY